MLELKNLFLKVEKNNKKIEILKNINLIFEKNKVYVIIGLNGGGKLFLVKIIMGINEVIFGSILLNGEDVIELDIIRRVR